MIDGRLTKQKWNQARLELKTALNAWEEASQSIDSLPFDELQMNEMKSLLKELKTKLEEFETPLENLPSRRFANK